MKATLKDTIAAGAVAGLAGGVAYLVAMEGDIALTRNNADDLVLIGGHFSRDRRRARQIGLGLHAGNSIVAGVAYGLVGSRVLPGPGWVRGVTFASIENLALYPLALFENHHPAIREGRLARYWTWAAFGQGVVRHVAFGAVTGAIYEAIRREQTLAKG
ncbi:MAG: hypothetical protein ACTHMX_14515 [Thermomicrobiales bacterium]